MRKYELYSVWPAPYDRVRTHASKQTVPPSLACCSHRHMLVMCVFACTCPAGAPCATLGRLNKINGRVWFIFLRFPTRFHV